MKVKNLFLFAAVILLIGISMNVYSQDGFNGTLSENKPDISESETVVHDAISNDNIAYLQKLHKTALEAGDNTEAEKIESQMNSLIPPENKFITIPDEKNSRSILNDTKNENELGDWMSSNSMLYSGLPKNSPLFHKQVEVKFGEDNKLYAVVNTKVPGPAFGKFYIYKSSDYGLNWSYIVAFETGGYTQNISMLVESRQNSNPDSTRIIVFYTLSNTDDLNSSSGLWFYSIRSNATGIKSGTVAFPLFGKSFTHLSAVSDGAYWQNATYLGVVATEENNVTGETNSIRFFQSINWCDTWTGSTLNTTYDDHFPSADYKEGGSDSIYIALERRFSETDREIRVLATTWNPS